MKQNREEMQINDLCRWEQMHQSLNKASYLRREMQKEKKNEQKSNIKITSKQHKNKRWMKMTFCCFYVTKDLKESRLTTNTRYIFELRGLVLLVYLCY